MNTIYEYPNAITKFFNLPIRQAKLITIYALQYEKSYVMATRDADQIAMWFNSLERIQESVASSDNAWTHKELLQTLSEYENDPSFLLMEIVFDYKENQ
jgi:hypothetical protein